MTAELWALAGLAGLGIGLIDWALWPERQPRAPRGERGRVGHHSSQMLGGETVRLHEHWPTAAAYVRPVVRCACPVAIEHGRISVPVSHYAGCPRAAASA
jgi:hypothetical protein